MPGLQQGEPVAPEPVLAARALEAARDDDGDRRRLRDRRHERRRRAAEPREPPVAVEPGHVDERLLERVELVDPRLEPHDRPRDHVQVERVQPAARGHESPGRAVAARPVGEAQHGGELGQLDRPPERARLGRPARGQRRAQLVPERERAREGQGREQPRRGGGPTRTGVRDALRLLRHLVRVPHVGPAGVGDPRDLRRLVEVLRGVARRPVDGAPDAEDRPHAPEGAPGREGGGIRPRGRTRRGLRALGGGVGLDGAHGILLVRRAVGRRRGRAVPPVTGTGAGRGRGRPARRSRARRATAGRGAGARGTARRAPRRAPRGRGSARAPRGSRPRAPRAP